jgi:hypothetical protein
MRAKVRQGYVLDLATTWYRRRMIGTLLAGDGDEGHESRCMK